MRIDFIDEYGRPLPPEPFKIFEDEEGWKGRGWDYRYPNKFYFNDIATTNQMAAIGQLATIMFGNPSK